MSTFTPPANATEVPGVSRDAHPLARKMFRWHGGNPRGRNVFYLSDGSVTETDPDGQTVFWTAGEGSPYVVQTWWGSTASAYTVTSEQASALTAAGYEVS